MSLVLELISYSERYCRIRGLQRIFNSVIKRPSQSLRALCRFLLKVKVTEKATDTDIRRG